MWLVKKNKISILIVHLQSLLATTEARSCLHLVSCWKCNNLISGVVQSAVAAHIHTFTGGGGGAAGVHTAVFSIIFFHNVLPIALRRESILTKKDCGNDIISTIFATNFCFYLSKKNPHLKRRNNSSKISCRPVLDDVQLSTVAHCGKYPQFI